MKLIVAGGRDFKDKGFLVRELDSLLLGDPHLLPEDVEIVHGGCPTGADRFAAEYAHFRDFRVKVFLANWDKYGKAAGPIRNSEMAEYVSQSRNQELGHCILFWNGKSTGTWSMFQQARKHRIPTTVYYY
jgi:hypothetical protein